MIKGTKVFKVTVSGGEIDPKPFNKYKDWKDAIENNGPFADGGDEKEGTTPYQLKAKANYRWMMMSMALNKGLETLSNVKAEATSSSIPGSVDFVLTYTQPDALWIDVDESEYEENNPEIIKTSDDRVLFLGSKAIKRIIEDTLKQEYKVILTYFSPEKVSSHNDEIYSSQLARGTVMAELVVEASNPSVTVDEDVLTYSRFDGEDDYPNLDADENE